MKIDISVIDQKGWEFRLSQETGAERQVVNIISDEKRQACIPVDVFLTTGKKFMEALQKLLENPEAKGAS